MTQAGAGPSPDLAELIEQLASQDAAQRDAAALALYSAGRTLAESATAAWREDPEFQCLVCGAPTVGIAVPPELFECIRDAAGRPPLADVPAEQSTQEFELHIAGAQLDVLTPIAGSGAIGRFLERFGPGIQQVEFAVQDVDHVVRLLASRFGAQPVYPETHQGANNTRMNFFLVSGPAGRKVLIEFFEQPQ